MAAKAAVLVSLIESFFRRGPTPRLRLVVCREFRYKVGAAITRSDNLGNSCLLITNGEFANHLERDSIRNRKFPGLIPPGRDRAWEVWDEPEEQLPNTQIAFKLLFPNLELAVRPEQKTSKEWRKEILYVDLRSRLPAGWMTVATVFVTRGNIRLQHEREPSIWLGSLEIGNGKWAQLNRRMKNTNAATRTISARCG
jgi:hypothetical protein